MTYFLTLKSFKQNNRLDKNKSHETVYLSLLISMFHDRNLCLKTTRDRISSLQNVKSKFDELIKETPTSFLGKSLTLMCPLDGIMHFGRIIDKRVECCGNTSFLVRFPAGREGRLSAFHQWINIEEHMIMVGASIIWAEKKFENKCSQWPGQKILYSRTAMILDKDKKACPMNFTRVAFFGFPSGDLSNILNKNIKKIPSSTFDKESGALEGSNPDLNKAVIAASMELEEQCRIPFWTDAFGDSSSPSFQFSMEKYQDSKSNYVHLRMKEFLEEVVSSFSSLYNSKISFTTQLAI